MSGVRGEGIRGPAKRRDRISDLNGRRPARREGKTPSSFLRPNERYNITHLYIERVLNTQSCTCYKCARVQQTRIIIVDARVYDGDGETRAVCMVKKKKTFRSEGARAHTQ